MTGSSERRKRTQRLYIILIEAPLDILDHQARLSNLRVPNHAHFDDDAAAMLVRCTVLCDNARTYSFRHY